MRTRCWIGFHKWIEFSFSHTSHYPWAGEVTHYNIGRVCTECHKAQVNYSLKDHLRGPIWLPPSRDVVNRALVSKAADVIRYEKQKEHVTVKTGYKKED